MSANINNGKTISGGVRLLLTVLATAVFCVSGMVGCNGDSGTGGGENGGDNGGDNGSGNDSGIVDGFFTDSRDGRRYGAISVGYLIWMTENLNYTGHANGRSWCYDDIASNCAKYGRLYDWDAAMSACPAGWNVPTHLNWNDLISNAGGSTAASTALKSEAPGWDGTNTLGFSALPGGSREVDGNFYGAEANGNWWTASEGGDNALSRVIFSGTGNTRQHEDPKGMGYSVRCVRRN